MSNIRTKELIICVISIIALVLTITTNVFATNSSYDDIINALGNQNTDNNEDGFEEIDGTTENETPNNTVPNNIVPNNIVPNNVVPNNTTNNTTNTMPNTGVSYSSVLIIAICGISAVYAYKKIRDYNV